MPSFIACFSWDGIATFDIRQMITYIIGVAALVSSALRPYQGPLADEAKASFRLVL